MNESLKVIFRHFLSIYIRKIRKINNIFKNLSAKLDDFLKNGWIVDITHKYAEKKMRPFIN